MKRRKIKEQDDIPSSSLMEQNNGQSSSVSQKKDEVPPSVMNQSKGQSSSISKKKDEVSPSLKKQSKRQSSSLSRKKDEASPSLSKGQSSSLSKKKDEVSPSLQKQSKGQSPSLSKKKDEAFPSLSKGQSPSLSKKNNGAPPSLSKDQSTFIAKKARTSSSLAKRKKEATNSFPQNEGSSLNWSNNSTAWPPITQENIDDYFLKRVEFDGLTVDVNKSIAAFNYVNSGHVTQVLCATTPSGTEIYLKAEVKPSQSWNAQCHSAWIKCSKTGHILGGGCSCKAGLGLACSHVAAICYQVLITRQERLNGPTCTDVPCMWNRGTKKDDLPITTIEQIDFSKPKKSLLTSINNKSASEDRNKHYSTEDEYISAVEKSGLSGLFQIKGSTINHSYKKVEPSNYHGDHSTNGCKPCNLVYKKFINFSIREITLIACKTVEQSDSSLWKEIRQPRITGSSAHRVPKKEQTDPNIFIINQLFPTFHGNEATRKGKDLEPIVIKKVEEEFNISIQRSGSVISGDHPWLCASPDGIWENMILEVKCPQNMTIFEFLISCKQFDATYDHETEVFSLIRQGARGYYLQVQLTMYCTKKDWCLFTYYLEKSDSLIPVVVEYDNQYVQKEIERLKSFYFNYMLPYVTSQLRCDAVRFTEVESFITSLAGN